MPRNLARSVNGEKTFSRLSAYQNRHARQKAKASGLCISLYPNQSGCQKNAPTREGKSVKLIIFTNVRDLLGAHSTAFISSALVSACSIVFKIKSRISSKFVVRRILFASICSVTASVAVAQQTPPQPALPAGSGQGQRTDASTPSPPEAREYFIDLKDGDHVPLELHVRIGLLNMGVSPAGVLFPSTGHHHILIDSPLPPFDQPILLDDNHIHLGSGETETDVVLTPGPHTLQLLMGDSHHMPHNPPVYSKVIHVVAAEPRTPSLPGAEVYFISLRDGATLPPTSTIRFGLRGMGVAPASVTMPNTGHHHLIIDADAPDLDLPIPADDKHLDLRSGVTETDLTLSPGKHTLQLVFGDRNHRNFDPPIQSKRITVTIRPSSARGR
jgi:Domain of unknown function (DUF4399)